jgi:hypothetical protein
MAGSGAILGLAIFAGREASLLAWSLRVWQGHNIRRQLQAAEVLGKTSF